MDDQERFEQRFIRASDDDCWHWIGWKNDKGYGAAIYGGRRQYAHRVSFQLYRGEIPDKLCVLHRCDNPACVNPKHLWLGTKKDNNQDRAAKGRSNLTDKARGEQNGLAKLTQEQVNEIRRRYAAGGITVRQLAKEYPVSKSEVHNIIRQEVWKGI